MTKNNNHFIPATSRQRPGVAALTCLALRAAMGLAMGASAVFAQPANTLARVPPASVAPLACLILPERVADIGSAVIGVVDAIEVERGDMVRKGQVLIRLRAEVERASNEVARSRAQSEAELRGALAAQDLAQQRLDRSHRLKAENFISEQAVEQADAELRVAREKVAQARESLRTLKQEVAMSDAQASQRILRSPFDGVVIERYANPGERFEDKPLLKLAMITNLRVEVVVPVSLFGNLRIGQQLMVQPELPGATPRIARVAQIDKVLDPASNTFRMRLEMPNADSALPAGLRCKIDQPARADAPPAELSSATAAR
ncbi:efflux RND transporter periplasmic adaptor subunit [Variovorax sp. HJSM1_2]|uniref:efflux RND transporter periplasmic adaptor subunit n=1 Tax=Variovorax sp. HJSM1_2 TaxID=3366263 RepID=UPI003BE2308A